MKILLAAPKVCTPWTEGRKRLVRDLAAALSRDHEVRVLTTVAAGEETDFAVPFDAPVADAGLCHLSRFHRQLGRTLRYWKPDLVCHLPIGSFHGMYRYGNLASILFADLQCRCAHAECFTMMYAIMQESSARELGRFVRHLLVNQYTAGAHAVRFGVAFPDSGLLAPGDERSLLFLAGMSERTAERLEHVLYLRGLATLMQAGRWLAPAGFTLTIGVPLLADARLCDMLLSGPDNMWPRQRLNILAEVHVPEVFERHGFFVFPYARNEVQFVPTSVVEAMHWGLPVVLPRHAFLSGLIRGGESAFAYAPGDPQDLARVLISGANAPSERERVRRSAAELVRREMNIAGTCEDLLGYWSALQRR